MQKACLPGAAVCALLLAGAARAEETTTYTYDALGRLAGASTSGGPNAGLTVGTAYDPAGNRSSYSVSAAAGSFSVADSSVTEGNFIYFTITKTGLTGQTCAVAFTTANGTATHPADYNGASSIQTFAPSEASKIISVYVHADGIAEGNETMRILLSLPGCGATIADGEAIGTISDP